MKLPERNPVIDSDHYPDAKPVSVSAPVSAGSEALEQQTMSGITPSFQGVAGRSSADKGDGTVLKTHAKSILSSLLNAALAAGEEGQSRACFKQLNIAHAILLVTAPDNNKGDQDEWR
jgi:hypothetical protein